MKKQKKIFLDMDNNLALFSTKGGDKIALENAKKKGYFRNLIPIEPNLNAKIKRLQELGEVYILSACMPTEYCKKEKKEWIQEHLPCVDSSKVILCNVGDNKADIIKEMGIEFNKDCILLDDYSKNIIQWHDLGGVAIKRRYSNKKGYDYIYKNYNQAYDIIKGL